MTSRIRARVRALHAYVPGEQPSGPDVLKLNTNENPYPPSPTVAEALARFAAHGLRRYPDPLCLELRARLAERHGCHPDQILVGNGSDEVLALCLRAFVERDRAAGWFDPSYSLYPVLAAVEGLEPRSAPLTPEFEWVDPEFGEVDLFFVTNPNAPTSLLFPKRKIEALADRFPGVLVVDEAYVDFAEADCLDLALSRPNVLVTRSFSKSWSLAGARLGYAVGPRDLIGAMFKIKDSYNVNRLSQVVGLAALSDPQTFHDHIAAILRTRAAAVRDLSARGFVVAASQTNFLWVKPPPGHPAPALFDALRSRRAFVRYFPGPVTGDYLRVTVGTDEEMERFLAVLDDLMEGLSP